ncbi:MAG: YafY family transcriptional regulator [Lachnospiraceae bacterium]|nr:YafY family transcriptional regulator [Lachnospiraceae bacterium]
MKTDRLYAITVYLLNHGKTSAAELSRNFEVSVRTIQRDIDSLCQAGIPVIATAGAAGGYEISDSFMLDKQLTTSDDYSYILTALQGLVSAISDPKAKSILEKVSYMSNTNTNGIILDFSVLREGDDSAFQILQSAVLKKLAVSFTYTNNNNETHTHNVEPIAVIYKWYAWYLLAYSKVKNEYRIYKLIRMRNIKITDNPFTKEHEPAELILQKVDATDSRKYISILVKCKETIKARVMEYLNGVVIKEYSNGEYLMELTVVENEQFWFGSLLSFGDNVEILEPIEIRDRLVDAAKKILSLYQKL